MIHAAFRDLVWRRRRYAISALGTALVFAVSLVVTGISDSFPGELDRTFESLRASSFVVPEGVSGPLTGSRPFDPAVLPAGVEPMAYFIQTANPQEPQTVALIGLNPGESEPVVASGRQLGGPDEVLVDGASSFETGSSIDIAGRSLEVVGRVDDLSVNAGMPVVVVPLESFQTIVLGGQSLATAGIAVAPIGQTPDGFVEVGLEEAREDALRILGDATSTIDLIKVLMWIVAALILGSVMYLSAVERTRDFAVFKAIGVATASMAWGMALQSVLLSVVAALVGEVLAFALAPVFPLPVTLSTTAMLVMPVIALLVGLLSGSFALRRAVSVEPALAFGGSA